MTALIVLAGGPATRLNGQFKPSLLVGGKRMINWQRRAAKADREILVAHQSQHFPERGMEMVWLNHGVSRGPVAGLQVALSRVDEPVLVAYADTWWSRTPPVSDWVGYCRADGGRIWDWIGYSSIGDCHTFNRDFIRPGCTVKACIGLYAFSDPDALRMAVDDAMDECTDDEVHMTEVLSRYVLPLDLAYVPEWMDTGDMDAWRRADQSLRSVA